MKKLLVCFVGLSIIFSAHLLFAQDNYPIEISWTTNPGDTAYGFTFAPGVNGSINNKCGLRAGYDFDQDGNLEFIAALQSNNETPGRDNILYLFEADGDNNYILRWSYQIVDVPHQRNGVVVADLDNDSNQEIVWIVDQLTDYTADNVFFFEFDPTLGNFPNTPTATWNTPRDFSGEFRCEVDLKVADIDQDNKQEIIFISFDGIVIASLSSQDFSSPTFAVEFNNISEYTWLFASAITDLDNSGTLELITFGGWGVGSFNILEALAADFYFLQVNQNLNASPYSCYNACTSADLDGNGYPEIYYAETNGDFHSIITNGPYNNIDISNFNLLDSEIGGEVLSIISQDSTFYVATSSNSQIFQIDYLGGDVTDSTNFEFTEIFADTNSASPITIFRIAGAIDLDGDTKKDIVCAAANHDSSRPTLYVIEDKNITSVEIPINNQILTDFTLEQNYPNPFNPVTTIAFNLPKENRITLKVYNSMGQEIKTLIANEIYLPGRHQVIWDATNQKGLQVSSGVYIYKLNANNFTTSKIMNFVR